MILNIIHDKIRKFRGPIEIKLMHIHFKKKKQFLLWNPTTEKQMLSELRIL